ncbi:hypothetical protein HY572_06380 [Candidatus Micrarchaeota archaeon]|nr:hypothetical protein [Candidatus Micrarchaeota archaeon]
MAASFVVPKRLFAAWPVAFLWLFLLSASVHSGLALAAALLFGFLFPGFALLKRLRVEVSGALFWALALLSSVLLSTYAVYLASLALGYSSSSVLLAFGVLSFLAYGLDASLPKISLDALAATAGFFALLFAFFSATLWVPSAQGVLVGAWNYSDLFAHLPIIESINHGNFPPQTPFFAGAPLTYHFFADFHTALVSAFSGVDVHGLIRFENALYGALVLLAAFSLASAFLPRKVAWLAVLLFLFGGGFGYLHFFADFAENPTLDLIRETPYDNDWQFFQVPSLLGGYLSVQRPQMVGIAVLAAVLALMLVVPRRREHVFLAGLLVGMLAPFQYFAFGAALMLLGVLFLFESRNDVRTFGLWLWFLPGLLFSVPFVWNALSVGGQAGLMRFTPGWLAPLDPVGFVVFYAGNLGLPFLLACAALVWTKLEGKALLGAWVAALFLLVNAVSLSGTQWDMAKFLAYLTLPGAVLAASFLAEQKKAVVFVVVLFSVLSPVLFLGWAFQSQYTGLTSAELEAGAWMKENVPELAVVAAYPVHNSPVDSVAGRLRLTGYSGWMNNYGLPYAERESALQAVYCGSEAESVAAAKKWGVSFVYVGPSETAKYACPHPFGGASYALRFDSGRIRVFEVS